MTSSHFDSLVSDGFIPKHSPRTPHEQEVRDLAESFVWETISSSQHEARDDSGRRIGVVTGDHLHSARTGETYHLALGNVSGDGRIFLSQYYASNLLAEEILSQKRDAEIVACHVGRAAIVTTVITGLVTAGFIARCRVKR